MTAPPDDAHDDEALVVPLWPDQRPDADERGMTHLWITLDPDSGPPEVRVFRGDPPLPAPPALAPPDETPGVMKSSAAPRIAVGEPLAPALQRVSLELLDHAIGGFSDPAVSIETAVHEARKSMKRVRSVLRLVRDVIGDDVYRPENAVLRDTARRLSGARDAAVLIGVVDDLTERFAGRLWPGAYERLREELASRHRTHEAALHTDRQLVTDVVMCLKTARARYVAWPTSSTVVDDYESVRRGIRRVYRRGQRSMRIALERPTAVTYHEWRKRVKYLRYQMEMLRELWPDLMEGLASSLARLAEDLGSEHDLAVLADIVKRSPELVPRYHDRDLLLTVIEGRRAELQHEARRLGRLVYLERPDVFVARIGAYWTASR